MKYLPGYFYHYASLNNWTRGEKIAYITVTYLDIATYSFLVLLAVRNIWAILYR